MTIETTTTIGGLNPSFPGGTDEIKEGDDHIRLMKSVLQTDALSLAKLTQQNVLGPVLFNQSVSVTQDLVVSGNIAGNAKLVGVTTLWNPAPELRFDEADQTDPNGRFRFLGNGNTFALQKALTASWASNEQIWAYTANAFQISKDVIFAAGARIENTTPDLRFADTSLTDPAGRYRVNVLGDAIHLQRALTANWATTTDIWNYDHATALLTIPKKVVAQGGLEVVGTAPRIEFTENDQTKPAGQYRILASSDNFYIQRALTADFATSITVMQCGGGADLLLFPIDDVKIGAATATPTVLTFQGTGAANYIDSAAAIPLIFRTSPGNTINARIDVAGTAALTAQSIMTREKGDLRYLNATGGTLTGPITIANTQPLFYFEETDQTDPAGRYRLYGSLGNFYFQKAATASWGSNNTIWSYDNVANEFGTTPNTKLATAGGTVEIGHSTASQVVFQRSGINYIKWPNAGSLYLLTDTGVNAAVLSGTLFNTYPLTKLAIDGGTVEIGNTNSSSIEFKRSSGGINYLKPPDGTTLRVQATGGGNWASVSSASGWVAGTCDIRLKENVVDIHYGLDTILALRSVEFDRLSDGLHDLGLVSQEVQPIVPEAIEPSLDEESGETYLFLRKDNFVPILIKAVQELTARVKALEGTPA